MPNADDIRWFKEQFHTEIEAAIEGTPLSLDMITALACQETGQIWPILRKRKLSTARILELCVGDSHDANSKPPRKAFPRTKAALLAEANGLEMFELAREALVDMAQFIPGFRSTAKIPTKICHGFGIFQLDLQFFPSNPKFFLEKRYANFTDCLQRCLGELKRKMNAIGFGGRTSLSDMEQAFVAIAYNIGPGNFKASKGLRQGFRSPDGRFYGESFFDFLRLSKTVALDGQAPIPAPKPGNAPLPPPSPVEATGRLFEVDVRNVPLRLRSEPKIDKKNPKSNVTALLPDGQIVQAVSSKKINGFLEVETSLLGAHLQGFAFATFLKAAAGPAVVPVLIPNLAPPASGIIAVTMPRRPGTITMRTAPADAHSLNESDQPGRKGTTPDELRAELAAIIQWLAVDKVVHKRYQPRNNSTFCNIYAHDYCHLAGAVLPRVWWTPGAIEKLTDGQSVEPQLNKTIDEQRANDLFRWLRDFGMRFGWRQASSLSELQLEVNQGAIGIIVARRNDDGRSGHIVAVVPETDEKRAVRNDNGDVITALQSQAGRSNFRYGARNRDWYKDARFADSAFWLHS